MGGLEGENYYGGVAHNTYSTGTVIGSGEVGALVGRNLATIDNSFWDADTSGITSSSGGVGSGNDVGVLPATTAQLESESYILANAPVSPTWNFDSVWTTNNGTSTPRLIGVPQSVGLGGSTGGNPGTTTGQSPGDLGTGILGGTHFSGGATLPPQLTPSSQNATPTLTFAAASLQTLSDTQQQPFAFTGLGDLSQGQALGGGLAFASGSSGQVVAGDAAQLNGGQMNNVTNPAASGALDAALSLAVHDNLEQALASVGGLSDTYDDNGTDTAGDSSDETETVGVGDVVEIGGGNVKRIPLSSAPRPLRDALDNGILQVLRPAGH